MRSVGLRGALLPLLPLLPVLPVVALLASCAVGPRYVPPQAGVPAGFDAARDAPKRSSSHAASKPAR